MRKIITLLLFISCSLMAFTNVYADNDSNRPRLNRIILQLQAQQWVQTKTAKVIVAINATLNKTQLAQAHQHIMQKLQQIDNKAQWHITNYQRSQGQSGLEQVNVTAQARIAEATLPGLRGKAKQASKPGFTLKIQSIEFTPSMADIAKVRKALRMKLYQQAKAEIAELNKIYPQQDFQIHLINFGGINITTPKPKYRSRTMVAAVMPTPAPQLQVGNKLIEHAVVVIASQFEDQESS